MSTQRPPSNGREKKLVMSFDVGTTFTGVSYVILEPGKIPQIFGVTNFPGQQTGDSKIPSVVLYDQAGSVFAVGAETNVDGDPDLIQNNELEVAEWVLSLSHKGRKDTLLVSDKKDDRSSKVLDVSYIFFGIQGSTTSFARPSGVMFVKFGSRSDNEASYGITSGNIKLTGQTIATFFDPTIDRIIQTVEAQIRNARVPIKSIFLVGGFCTSTYLYSRLDTHFSPRNINVIVPDPYLSKAVAEGSLYYYIDHSVTSRMSKCIYGVRCTWEYNPSDPENRARQHTVFLRHNGRRYVLGGFTTMIRKGVEVSETQEYRSPFMIVLDDSGFANYRNHYASLHSYQGAQVNPMWDDRETEMFSNICEIVADVSPVKRFLSQQYDQSARFYRIDYEVVLLFGHTELKAQIAWKENGQEKRGPAAIVYRDV
ncbi:hypothetical protein AMATHDRAFT_5380 [Amanita thiersii Skay4041]|uniref:Uncharacterized protein n=1 Tax=Amanita thiersii Skay4041 TaxID=703135 RepID=A0A2A9NKR5_9AGAR|nr:hypothetical protein AMATHDRAFT_5380 [Amanita thiersii Skay4041]